MLFQKNNVGDMTITAGTSPRSNATYHFYSSDVQISIEYHVDGLNKDYFLVINCKDTKKVMYYPVIECVTVRLAANRKEIYKFEPHNK